MAFIVAVIEIPGESIAQLNVIQNSGNPHEAVTNLKNICKALVGGVKDGDVQITVRSTDPSVATAGSGSTQVSYDLS